MHKFYKDLKEMILNQDELTKKTLIPYYETLFQLSNYQEMKELLDTYQEKEYTIDYNDADENDYYSNGWLEIYGHNESISFTIELDIGDIQGGYCQCNPSDEGYNVNKDCCGVNCDVHLPKVSILKEVKMINYEFQGHECDLWALEEKWLTAFEKDLLHKKKVEKANSLEAQIEQLQKELDAVKSDIKN